MISSRLLGVGSLLVAALGWGVGWVAMKTVLQTWTPLFARGLAGVIAAVLLAVVACHRRDSLILPRQVTPRLVLSAFTNVFAWMGFSALCLKWLTVGEGTLLVYTMPIWATLFAWIFLGSRPTLRGFVSLVLGLAGIGILLGGNSLTLSAGTLLGVAFALGAAILFALGSVLNRSEISIPLVAFTAWQVALGCFPMLIIGLIGERPNIHALDSIGIAAMGYMIVLPMGICYLAWFEALRRLPPAVASTSILLTPLTGILSASLLLAEPLGLREVLAAALTLGGVALALHKNS